MAVTISRAACDAMLAAAAADPTKEVCGLLFGSSASVDVMTSVENVASDSASSFEIDPAQLIAAHRAERSGGLRLIGYFHSHPIGLGEPSATDRAMAHPDDRLWVIAASGALSAWRATKAGFTPVDLVPDG